MTSAILPVNLLRKLDLHFPVTSLSAAFAVCVCVCAHGKRSVICERGSVRIFLSAECRRCFGSLDIVFFIES